MLAWPSFPALLDAWRSELAAWADPRAHQRGGRREPLGAAAAGVRPPRGPAEHAAPSGPSYDRAWAALDPPGSVLDVGAGAGAACLPLLARTTGLTAVDSDAGMLDLLAERAAAHGVTGPVRARQLAGGRRAGPGRRRGDLPPRAVQRARRSAPFVAALTAHARRLVVAEMTASHPLVTLNALWLKFHGLRRPDGPTADDLLAHPGRDGPAARPSAVEPPRRGGLRELRRAHRRHQAAAVPAARSGPARWPTRWCDDGRRPARATRPTSGSSGREVVTIWWQGGAAEPTARIRGTS